MGVSILKVAQIPDNGTFNPLEAAAIQYGVKMHDILITHLYYFQTTA